ncbi:MAG: hypothetical protein JNM66_10120 [Bryobacterales bacterium]|nr:hypothetical protein [Bryobacterales bacterium]
MIIILSLAMFVYWFRYSCVLILESDWSEDQARAIASQNGLSFSRIEDSLTGAESAQALDKVRDSLDRDLDRVLALLSKCPGVQEAGQSLECRMLMLDYRLMQAWYAVTRSTASPKAQHALREMALVVGYLAGECGDHLATARSQA